MDEDYSIEEIKKSLKYWEDNIEKIQIEIKEATKHLWKSRDYNEGRAEYCRELLRKKGVKIS